VLEWEQRCAVRASESGIVKFADLVQVNQHIQSQQVLCYVTQDSAFCYAQLQLSQHNLGQVMAGQRVQVRLLAFPYQQFGYLPAILGQQSTLPKDSFYLAPANFTDASKTNLGKSIAIRDGMQCTAQIIANETRLIDRLLNQVLHTW
jgi:hypothetical protein